MKAKLFYKNGLVSYTDIPYGERYWKVLGSIPPVSFVSHTLIAPQTTLIPEHQFMFNRFGKFNKEIISIYVEI